MGGLRLVYGIDRTVLLWISERLPLIRPDFADHYNAIGVALEDRLIAGVMYSRYTGTNIEISMAASDPRWCTRGTLYFLLGYPFLQLGCQRITAVTGEDQLDNQRFFERLGFRWEGILREALPERKNALIFGLLAGECRWTKHRRLAPPDPGELAHDRADPLSLAGADVKRFFSP